MILDITINKDKLLIPSISKFTHFTKSEITPELLQIVKTRQCKFEINQEDISSE
jgi:hypothetical protein